MIYKYTICMKKEKLPKQSLWRGIYRNFKSKNMKIPTKFIEVNKRNFNCINNVWQLKSPALKPLWFTGYFSLELPDYTLSTLSLFCTLATDIYFCILALTCQPLPSLLVWSIQSFGKVFSFPLLSLMLQPETPFENLPKPLFTAIVF
jgi:hypothetical protein